MSEELIGKYKLVLGLEIHLHLKTERKMFCRCKTDVYGSEPNTHTCPTCLGLPGALPVPNPEAIRKTHILGLALKSKICKESRFDRKHYFYPDLPKGYQISQYKKPLCLGGFLELHSGRRADIERVHLEEDTAKSIHEGDKTLIDFNLSSMPLVEIVTKPTFTDVEDAVEFCHLIQQLVRDLKLGDADMEKGQMRLEPNISLRTAEMESKNKLPGYKVEIKNINSFKFMKKAVKAEVKRQRKMLDEGKTPRQENRGYVESEKTTVSQRSKEHAHDYRYFPEPDIPPMVFDSGHIEKVKKEYEELLKMSPSYKKETMLADLKIKNRLKKRAEDQLSIETIEKILKICAKDKGHEKVVNLFLNNKDVWEKEVDDIIKMIEEEKDKMDDEDILQDIVSKVISKNQDAVESYLSGKDNALQYLIGMVMKETKGKADAEISKELILKNIK